MSSRVCAVVILDDGAHHHHDLRLPHQIYLGARHPEPSVQLWAGSTKHTGAHGSKLWHEFRTS